MGSNNHKVMAMMTAATTMRGGCWCRCDNLTVSHYEVKSHEWQQRLRWQTRGCSSSCVCAREACCPWATARAVKMTATSVMKKTRGSRVTRVRVTRVMMETSPREEGDDGHNNQLGTKAAATVRTVVATTARAITTAARVTATGAKRAMATMATKAMTMTMTTTVAMVTTATMTPNGKDDNKNQAATAARAIKTVARATVIGAKRAMVTMVTTATTATMATMAMMAMTAMTVAMAKMATMMPNSNNATSGDKGNEDTKQLQ
jgi:hypothetical protein